MLSLSLTLGASLLLPLRLLRLLARLWLRLRLLPSPSRRRSSLDGPRAGDTGREGASASTPAALHDERLQRDSERGDAASR
jgi:hypothetical protein